jgi:putative DNA methylase
MANDRRLIEDYLPIQAISAEASREKSVRKGHISTLHLWWARRPLVACRAAVYGALVPADQFQPANGPESKRASLGRANAAKFLKRLCIYPGDSRVIAEAQRHILEAHARRLTEETEKTVTREDIEAGRAPRPKVLDMFAGGGAIPLEALRLGCEAYALDLNPVAYIILLCTLVYPQKYGKPEPAARGMTGQKNSKGETTWGGLAKEVRYWGNWVLKKVKAEIGDLYPLIPDPEYKGERSQKQLEMWQTGESDQSPPGYLVPVAYLWTRTVKCKNPGCGATVPLVRQTWLCKKKGRYVAMKMIAPPSAKEVRFEVVEAAHEKDLGFDPTAFSKGGNASCPFCGTVADSAYVKAEGCARRMGQHLMAIVCIRYGKQGKIYLSKEQVFNLFGDLGKLHKTSDEELQRKIESLCARNGVTVPDEPIEARMTGGICLPYGLINFGNLFSLRQTVALIAFVSAVREAHNKVNQTGLNSEYTKAVVTILSTVVDRLADFNSSLCVHNYFGSSRIAHTFGRQALSMTWDFAEANPFHEGSGGWGIQAIYEALSSPDSSTNLIGNVIRGSATSLTWSDMSFDAVITDPPYYDNVDYAKLSDFFFVWLKRSIGSLYPEHFTSYTTPKKIEIVADPVRHEGSREKAKRYYETMMAKAFSESHRVLKPGGSMITVYAHKTTLGWATLVDALRQSGFMVTEAWPLDTEKPGRLVAQETSALASSILLVAKKRNGAGIGSYEEEVRPELEQIVRERVDTLWNMGITGADLVIASVGAGLRAFTRFVRVEYANGEEVPAARFLTEVETVVLETILQRLSKEVGGNGIEVSLAGVDPATRFYILWRYTYKFSVLDAGEAIVFAHGTHVELDGPNGLSTGARALLENKKGKYHLCDFRDRGEDKKLGLRRENGELAPLIDALHRILWLMEHRPGELADFLQEAQPNKEQVRLVAQALAGPALKGGELGEVSPPAETAALAKLTANWKSLVESPHPLFK